jgi:hypothetical protein
MSSRRTRTIRSGVYSFRQRIAIFERPTGYDEQPYCIAVQWEDKLVNISADDALAPKDGRSSEDLEKAKDIIRCALAQGPVLQRDIVGHLEAELISRKSWRNAKDKLGVKSRRREDGSKNPPWEWYWPEGQEVM